MKLKKHVLIVLSIISLFLQLSPYGAVLNFSNPDGELWRSAYSYFSSKSFAYANFGPLVTAVLTFALVVLTVIGLFKSGKGLNIAVLNVSGFATAASIFPFILGIEYITAIGAAITLFLAGVFGACFIRERK